MDQKPRKSVAFSEGTTIVDSNGDVMETNGMQDKTTAESHSSMRPTSKLSTWNTTD